MTDALCIFSKACKGQSCGLCSALPVCKPSWHWCLAHQNPRALPSGHQLARPKIKEAQQLFRKVEQIPSESLTGCVGVASTANGSRPLTGKNTVDITINARTHRMFANCGGKHPNTKLAAFQQGLLELGGENSSIRYCL